MTGLPSIVCRARLSAGARRVALMKHVQAREVEQWVLPASHRRFGRAVQLLPAVDDGTQQELKINPETTVALHGEPFTIRPEGSASTSLEVQWWDVPRIVTTRGDLMAIDEWPDGVEAVLDIAERVEQRVHARALGLSPGLVDTTRTWLDGLRARAEDLRTWIDQCCTSVARDSAVVEAAADVDESLERLVGLSLWSKVEQPSLPEGWAVPPSVIAVDGHLAESAGAVRQRLDDFIERVRESRAEMSRRGRLSAERKAAAIWARNHGSPRLTKAVELGLIETSMGVYRDERLAHEAPSWMWLPDIEDTRPPVNPSEDALDRLGEVRAELDKSAQLRFDPDSKLLIVTARRMSRDIWTPAENWIDPEDIHRVIADVGRRRLAPRVFSRFLSALIEKEQD